MATTGTPVPLPAVGDLLDGKYRIVRVIGEGGVGIVYEAEHQRLGQRVAIKMLLPATASVQEAVKRFDREARAVAKLRGPHVARVFDVGGDGGPPYMVMEFLEGHDLGQELKKRQVLPVDEAVDYLLEACAAMAEAHALGIIHRDLKPSNLFLCREGDRQILKVVDFGISKTLLGDEGAMTATESTLGTPAYMSPEQMRSAKHVDSRADIWSLGVILFRALTGKLPFGAGNAATMALAVVNDPPRPMAQLRPDLHPGLVEVTMRALAKNPDQRYPSVEHLSAALAPFGSGRVPALAAPEPMASIPTGAVPTAVIPTALTPTAVAAAAPAGGSAPPPPPDTSAIVAPARNGSSAPAADASAPAEPPGSDNAPTLLAGATPPPPPPRSRLGLAIGGALAAAVVLVAVVAAMLR